MGKITLANYSDQPFSSTVRRKAGMESGCVGQTGIIVRCLCCRSNLGIFLVPKSHDQVLERQKVKPNQGPKACLTASLTAIGCCRYSEGEGAPDPSSLPLHYIIKSQPLATLPFCRESINQQQNAKASHTERRYGPDPCQCHHFRVQQC